MIKIIVPTGKGREEKYAKCRESLKDREVDLFVCSGDEGFTKAVNLEITQTLILFPKLEVLDRNLGIEYIFLLNDDTEVFPETIPSAIKFMESHPDCGIMGCQNLDMTNPDKIIWGGSGHPHPAGQHKIGQVSLGDLREPTKERWVTFSSAFIRREVFETIGLLDEKMVWVYSDSDFCYRARYWGWECWYNPESKILHEHNISRNPDKKRLMQFRLDKAAFEAKWMNGKAYFDLDSELL